MVNNSKKARVITYGCAQNENDSEKIRAMLLEMGYTITDSNLDADLILFNTCAVRDNAEQRVYGNIGALKSLKEQKTDLLIGVCGCMAQQSHVAQHIKTRFPHVDFVFGTYAINRFRQIVYSAISQRVFDIDEHSDELAEMPAHDRLSGVVATVSVMYGCNNFCSYCIVPYVRGREKSRPVQDIINEVNGLAAQGYKEITLLGQNVNSYSEVPFYRLLDLVSKVDGIERIRFISSHPKDITDDLIDTIANNPKVCKQLHLPFQAGSNKVLNDMNRGYTREKYLDIIKRIKQRIPDITLTGDVIVGFPTETNEDFEKTIELVSDVGFDMLFTFIYSKREGTPAQEMAPVLTEDEVKNNFNRLLALQNDISAKKNKKYIGKFEKVLVEGQSKNNKKYLTGRTDGGKIVNFKGDQKLIGKIIDAKITKAATWSLTGRIISDGSNTQIFN
ncbi:MAG: tRNA (N6-isopentenyl adenosine(37)-C2)-methylthiotransferase MiaB [Clostridiaceae bacterium]|jgi:tRNA-2-methylthio-N6-dimethylallyladenosine synthase|nr:tRNA (N6-isopentenyl adenosine(37)-C2)-methylthiotransferase MiaB [Clostridiaceae bacterium]